MISNLKFLDLLEIEKRGKYLFYNLVMTLN